MLSKDEILKKLEEDKDISKSQKKHLKKVAKRRERREKRINKQIEQQITSTKLIEENHNGGDYSPEFIKRASDYYLDYFWNSWISMVDDPNRFLYAFQKIREKIQTLVLKWPPSLRNDNFKFFVRLLDLYREDKGNGENLLKETYNYFKYIQKFNTEST